MRLYKIASLQQGFFTARQAKEAGYSDSRFPYHVSTGKWTKEGRGIYRLADYPEGDRPDLVYWSMWSCNRKGEVQGVFSHQTALVVHDLSDLMPAKYHLTVPKKFRKYHESPENLVLHFDSLKREEIWELEGYRVTSPIRTVFDLICDESISDEFVVQAIEDGFEKGLFTKNQFEKIANQENFHRMIRIMNKLTSN